MAKEIYAISAFSGETIYPEYLMNAAIGAGLSCTGVDVNDIGDPDSVVFHFPSALSAGDRLTLDGIVASYVATDGDPGEHLYLNTEEVRDTSAVKVVNNGVAGHITMTDSIQAPNSQGWRIDSSLGDFRIATATDDGDHSASAIEVKRTGLSVDSVDIGSALNVSGEVTAALPTSGSSLATKSYVDALAGAGVEWQDSVKSVANDPPGSPADGDRHIVGTSPTGAFAGHANDIASYESSAWSFATPTHGTTVTVDSPIGYRTFNGASWVSLGSGVSHANLIKTTGDHPEYVMTDGSRAITGDISINADLDVSGDLNASIDKLTTIETDQSKVLVPDGSNGVAWAQGSGREHIVTIRAEDADTLSGVGSLSGYISGTMSGNPAYHDLSTNLRRAFAFDIFPPSWSTNVEIHVVSRPGGSVMPNPTANAMYGFRFADNDDLDTWSPESFMDLLVYQSTYDWVTSKKSKSFVDWGFFGGKPNRGIFFLDPDVTDVNNRVDIRALYFVFT